MRAGWLAVLIWIVAALAAPHASATEGRRVALVVGNGGYQNFNQLPNPPNDARMIAATLKADGFDLIGGDAQLDLTLDAFNDRLKAFTLAAKDAGAALFYYAGHGQQMEGVNWLLPVDVGPSGSTYMSDYAVSADEVQKRLDATNARIKILILDACRSGPFGSDRGAGNGLAMMEGSDGMLISFATKPGRTALDGKEGGHSPYALALDREFHASGIKLLDLFNRVSIDVEDATDKKQRPSNMYGSIRDDFYFLAPGQTVPYEPPPAVEQPAAPAANPPSAAPAAAAAISPSGAPSSVEPAHLNVPAYVAPTAVLPSAARTAPPGKPWIAPIEVPLGRVATAKPTPWVHPEPPGKIKPPRVATSSPPPARTESGGCSAMIEAISLGAGRPASISPSAWRACGGS